MCMQNMVWKYCKSISPEWKHQVSSKLLFFFFKLYTVVSSRILLIAHSPPPSPLFCSSKLQMEQKMVASEIFKDKKDNYPQSVPKLFVGTRLSE